MSIEEAVGNLVQAAFRQFGGIGEAVPVILKRGCHRNDESDEKVAKVRSVTPTSPRQRQRLTRIGEHLADALTRTNASSATIGTSATSRKG